MRLSRGEGRREGRGAIYAIALVARRFNGEKEGEKGVKGNLNKTQLKEVLEVNTKHVLLFGFLWGRLSALFPQFGTKAYRFQ